MTKDFTKSDTRLQAEQLWLAQSQPPFCAVAPAEMCQRTPEFCLQCGTGDDGSFSPCPWVPWRMANNGIRTPKDFITVIDAYTLVIT